MSDRKLHVLRIAQRLFTEKGFATTSIQDILDEANISKGTFYNYFRSKNECLMAILEHAYEEATILRRELLIGESLEDPDVLAKQIAVRLVLNREQNLLPLYDAIYYSGDDDLRSFIQRHHRKELTWLARRFIDLYGEEVRPYVADLVLVCTGVLQHYLHFMNARTIQPVDTETLVRFSLLATKGVFHEMKNTNCTFIGPTLFKGFPKEEQSIDELREHLLQQLQTLQQHELPMQSAAYLSFIHDELQKKEPRLVIIGTIIRSLRESLVHTKLESAIDTFSADCWEFIDRISHDQKSE